MAKPLIHNQCKPVDVLLACGSGCAFPCKGGRGLSEVGILCAIGNSGQKLRGVFQRITGSIRRQKIGNMFKIVQIGQRVGGHLIRGYDPRPFGVMVRWQMCQYP